MKASQRMTAALVAVALGATLTACASSGGSTSGSSNGSDGVAVAAGRLPSGFATPAANANAANTSTLPLPSTTPADRADLAAVTPSGGSGLGEPSLANPDTGGGAAAGSTTVARPSQPVSYESISFPHTYNCDEHGTSYYTGPNISIAMDVTLLVTSSQLAHDLTITAPNRALSGTSNASQWLSAVLVGKGVWRATYRTFVSLYEPKYTPVTISHLSASAGGTGYTIEFPSPVSVSVADCYS